jgi:hypothetical protein
MIDTLNVLNCFLAASSAAFEWQGLGDKFNVLMSLESFENHPSFEWADFQ